MQWSCVAGSLDLFDQRFSARNTPDRRVHEARILVDTGRRVDDSSNHFHGITYHP